MKVTVTTAVHYDYEVEIPDDTTGVELLWKCDTNDPVYENIARALDEAKLNYDVATISILKEDTNEIIYNL